MIRASVLRTSSATNIEMKRKGVNLRNVGGGGVAHCGHDQLRTRVPEVETDDETERDVAETH